MTRSLATDQALQGIHHVTAYTDNITRNYHFFTEILGMRLVKKSINQDDIETYHTFYADDHGSPGTDMTFFDFKGVPSGSHGTNSISRTGLRVPSDEALMYYKDRFEERGVVHGEIEEVFGANTLTFEEPDGQRYRLFSDENNTGVEPGIPWKNAPTPTEYTIYGLGPIEVTVSYYTDFLRIMQEVFNFNIVAETTGMALLSVGKGGHGGQMILKEDRSSPMGRQGDGQVHHVAFRVKDKETISVWADRYDRFGIPHSGVVNRFYFWALYTRIGAILIELSTDDPGFMVDEPYETLGEKLSLPPFLEKNRKKIETAVKPFDTSSHNQPRE